MSSNIALGFLVQKVACQSKTKDSILDFHLYDNPESITMSFEEI